VTRLPLHLAVHGSELRLPPAEEPGNYRLVYQDVETLIVSINIPSTESDLSDMSKEQRAHFRKVWGALFIDPSTRFIEQVRSASKGTDLFLIIILILCCLCIAEIVIANKVSE
jgi:hypothetical protein